MTGGQDGMFWAIAVAVALMVAAILLTALWRGRSAGAPAAAYDLRVYRDQLTEIERDAARGVIADDEAARLRTEISRRVLDADRALAGAAVAAPSSPGNALVISVVVVGLLGASFWGYWRLGTPGYADLPMSRRIAEAEAARMSRPSQAQAETQFGSLPDPATQDPQYLALMDKLRQTVKDRPDDVQGHAILAKAEAHLGNFTAAYAAQKQMIALKGDAVTATDQAALAELLIMAAGGFVSADAEAALTRALTLDPENGTARYYSGLMLAQTGRPDSGFKVWRALLESSHQGDPWLEPLLTQIGDMAAMAGVEYQPPGMQAQPGMPGPTQGDMAAAANMSETDRNAMIETMVGQLATRLEAEGGTAAEWARLIGAYGVLGKTDAAKAAWAKAQTTFAAAPADLETVRAAAQNAGVAE